MFSLPEIVAAVTFFHSSTLNRNIMKPSLNFAKSTSALATALLLTFATASAYAKPIKETKISNPAEKLVTVSYVGATESSFIFHVSFDNRSGEKFWLIVKNDAGDVVYEQAYKDSHFDKAILIPKESDAITPSFVIRTANTSVERKFVVNRQLSENVVVTTL
jgi:hypothetical protein